MPWVQFVLSIDELEGLVIIMEDKRSRLQMMALISQGPHYSIEFLVISVVVAP